MTTEGLPAAPFLSKSKPVRLARYPVRTYANAFEYGSRFVTRVWREADEQTRRSGKLAVHFDIDFTLLDENSPFVLGEDEFLMPIKEIVQLLLHCRRTGFKIIIITARPKTGEAWTRANLALFQIPFDGLIFSGRKAEWKKSLFEKRGIRFVMSVGDSIIDIVGSHSGEPILLKTPGKLSYR